MTDLMEAALFPSISVPLTEEALRVRGIMVHHFMAKALPLLHLEVYKKILSVELYP